ncbi:uncharacterized protein LOC117097394 [Trachypithecus francoisi]|uniref:uncharacterized protein LOC117097394 n=1 Tax=Trachypithecus francoisi TaxID=54180 RepID=UPI00141ABB95|nr:uncharacterized protein LOC117097394 [Trachypithecus francoisi]
MEQGAAPVSAAPGRHCWGTQRNLRSCWLGCYAPHCPAAQCARPAKPAPALAGTRAGPRAPRTVPGRAGYASRCCGSRLRPPRHRALRGLLLFCLWLPSDRLALPPATPLSELHAQSSGVEQLPEEFRQQPDDSLAADTSFLRAPLALLGWRQCGRPAAPSHAAPWPWWSCPGGPRLWPPHWAATSSTARRAAATSAGRGQRAEAGRIAAGRWGRGCGRARVLGSSCAAAAGSGLQPHIVAYPEPGCSPEAAGAWAPAGTAATPRAAPRLQQLQPQPRPGRRRPGHRTRLASAG